MTLAQTRFTTDAGLVFNYNHKSNALSDEAGVDISLNDSGDFSEYIELAKTTYGKRTKSNTPTALRILMGHACNYNCTYCMQKDIGNPNELPRRKNLDTFFENIAEHLDITKLTRIELWGGEPFLYWQDMQALMTYFDREGMSYAISTNGSALHHKHSEFFKTLKSEVIISISHDGPRQLQLRGEEIFTRPRVISTLQEFDALPNVRYGFQCSVTNTNYDLFAINDFFRNQIVENNLQTWNLYFSLGRTYQEKPSGAGHLGCNVIEEAPNTPPGSDSQLHVIHGENIPKFRVVLAEFLEAHYQQFTKHGFDGDQPAVFSAHRDDLPLLFCDIYESTVAYSVIEYARKTICKEPILESTNCGADMSDILSTDLDGSVRTCPHAGEKHIHGHISNLKTVRIISLDINAKESHCGGCINRVLCRSSCPIKLPDETFLTNCRVEKVWYGEIQKAAFRLIFGQKLASAEEVTQ